jgi:hypothetical protein
MAEKQQINFQVTKKEMEILKKYCDETGNTQTAVLRGLIGTLEAHTAAKAAESLQGG